MLVIESQSIKEAPLRRTFYLNLEALRGFAAIMVALYHCFGFSVQLNGVDQNSSIWRYEFPGHFAVLLFFILSGYVIGVSSKRLSWQTTGAYLKKRFLRLYPIYVLSILLTLAITHNQYPAAQVASNLAFLQRVTAGSLYEVAVNWSLNYEVLYYLLFIPISIYAFKPAHMLVAAVAFGLFFQFVASIPLLAMYGYGFCFWLTGLWLARTPRTTSQPASLYTLVGLLLLLLCFNSLDLMHQLLRFNLHVDYMRNPLSPNGAGADHITAIMPSDFSGLPLGVLLIAYFTDKRLPYGRFLWAYVLSVPLLFLLFLFYHSRTHPGEWSGYVLPMGFYLAALLLMAIGKLRPVTSPVLLPRFAVALGGLSYSIYLFHLIVLLLLSRLDFFSGNSFTFALRSVVVLLGSWATSYVLEKVWQPFAVSQLKKLSLFQ